MRNFTQVRCAEVPAACGGVHMNSTGHIVSDTQFSSWIASQQRLYAGVIKDLPPYSAAFTRPKADMSDASISVSRREVRLPSAWRQLLGYNVVWRVALHSIGGLLLGHWIGAKIRRGLAQRSGTDRGDLAILMGLAFATLDWVAGLRFLNYPLRAFLAIDPARARGARRMALLQSLHRPQGRRDPVPGRGPVLLLRRRAERDVHPHRAEQVGTRTVIPAGNYLTLVGPARHDDADDDVGEGPRAAWRSCLIPIMIGARRMAFPRIEALTMWLTVLAGFVL